MITSFKKWWIYLSGFEQHSQMEHRMFNVVSLICFFTLIIIGLANYALGLPKVGNWTLLMVPLLAFVYYLARFADRFALASFLFASLSYVMMMGNYLLNSGINGPTVYGFLLTFLIIILITPPKTHILWFSLHVISVLGLYIFEASNPSVITYQYNDTYAQMADHILTYVPVLLFMYIAGIFLRKSYNSEKKLADERLTAINEQKQELEFTNKEKDRLFSIIGHDLRSPLNSIQGYLEILNATNLSVEDRNEIQHQLYDLTTNTSHLLNNLLLWSSKTGDKLKLSSLDLKEATMEVVDLIQPQAYKKSVEISCAVPKGELVVKAERDMIQLVIRNILSNAVKFTPAKGKVNLWCEANGQSVTMFIQDNGTGIPKNKQADIFTSQAKSTKGTAHESGIGLGLVLCKEFVSAMDGSINFESIENEGSTFSITLNKG
ncbi:sensor histidine kinase [Owenweeksia hongkongensis]|uniref:sensor histidine kinase n=1 Tax=Owenweeksia hongkongensis TaxID=253245 RepID=UPI003A93305B